MFWKMFELSWACASCQIGRGWTTMKTGSIDQGTLEKINAELKAHLVVNTQDSAFSC